MRALRICDTKAVSGYRAAMDRLFGADACKVLKIRKYGGMKVLA